MTITKPAVHDKGWGQEEWVTNNPLYCGKLLHFKERSRSSLHFHRFKDETWYVVKGVFELHAIDPKNGQEYIEIITSGDCVEIKCCEVHGVYTETGGVIFEVSTHHDDADTYRVLPGDSQMRGTEEVQASQ